MSDTAIRFSNLKKSFIKDRTGKYQKSDGTIAQSKFRTLSIPVMEDISDSGFVRIVIDKDGFHNGDEHGVGIGGHLVSSKDADVHGYVDFVCDEGANFFSDDVPLTTIKVRIHDDNGYHNCFMDAGQLKESYEKTDYYKGTCKKLDLIKSGLSRHTELLDNYSETTGKAESMIRSASDKDKSKGLGE